MFDNINKSKIAFEKYLELKRETLTKSYTERFKWIDKFLYWFSWFGNGVSIFLAFFFIQALFLSSFIGIKDSIFVTLGIIFFLTLFELLKRYVFGLFSVEFIKNKFSMFKLNMVSFIFGVLVLIVGSFYFSLNGAMKFVDNRKVFQEQVEVNIQTRIDSLNSFYFTEYIRPLMDENRMLNEQNVGYAEQAATTSFRTRYTDLINANNQKIEANRSQIIQYENRRDNEISTVRQSQISRLDEALISNRSNIIAFIIISSLIEIIIMLGIYYDRFFSYKIIDEYEKTIVSTPEFKTWYKFNSILNLIYSKVNDVGEQLPSTNALLELCGVSGEKTDKSTMDKFIKIMYYLGIISLQGNRRILNMPKEQGLKKLRDYFEIN